MSRTKRKPKTGAKAVDRSCGNNGSCGYCLGSKMHKHNKKLIKQDRENIYETESKALPDGTNHSNSLRSTAS